MSVIRNCNFSKGRLADLASMDIQNGDTFEGCNFAQVDPHTEVLSGYTGLVFKNCLLINCDLPPDATIVGKQPKHRSFCTHLHRSKIGASGECMENCDHVVEIDTVTIDGQVVETIYHYADTELI